MLHHCQEAFSSEVSGLSQKQNVKLNTDIVPGEMKPSCL